MGNNVCCEETRTQGTLEKHDPQIIKRSIIVEPPKKVQEVPHVVQEKVQHIPEPEPSPKHPVVIEQKPIHKETIQIPDLAPRVKEVLLTKKFFQEEQEQLTNRHVKRYAGDVYVGTLDEFELKPNGLGRMYKPDRSLYIGHFNHGKAHGKGAYVFADGSYYYGEFSHNCADSHNGEFFSQTIHYIGGFKNNRFQGKGMEKGKGYIFQGDFEDGVRTKGTLKWGNDAYVYTGPFNEKNQFHGKGRLQQPEGTYEGDFVHGEKQGNGSYLFNKGSKYVGTYSKGIREGYGIIYHGTGQVAYKGEMKGGLPHGKGYLVKDGKDIETTWVEGIDVNLLPI